MTAGEASSASSAGPGTGRRAGAGGVRRRHTARWVAAAVVVVLVVVAIVAATRPSYQATQEASPLVGHRAPQISGGALTGKHVSLAGYRGRYVYVNFFASWCPPCQVEEPNLVEFAYQQQKKGTALALLSVVFNDSDAAAAAFVKKVGAQWPAVPDRGGAIANAYGVDSPPMTFLVNPRGTIVGTWTGPATVAQLDSMLAEARQSASASSA